MKGFVIYTQDQTENLTALLAQEDGCHYTSVEAIKCESVASIGGGNCFNLKKAEEELHIAVTTEEIANTLSHIECWRKIVEDEQIAENEFVLICEADVQFSPNYVSALQTHIDHYLAHSGHQIVLLERRLQDEEWDDKIYTGVGEVNSITFNWRYFYDSAHCKTYLIRKHFASEMLTRLVSEKPYWLSCRFSYFCQSQKITQTLPLVAKPLQKIQPRLISVKSIDESLDFILENDCSVIRFGDGEIMLIRRGSIGYQEYNAQLATQLLDILKTQSTKEKLICVPNVFHSLERHNPIAVNFWKCHLAVYRELYERYCGANWYGNAFISRPYIDWQDKSHSARWFEKLKQIWQGKDILIVEGETSRSGVGNDLFAEANSIKRIICPSKNAYNKIEEIQKAIVQRAEDRLILLMLGPTAKVLAWNLSELGFRAIDIGHIDSEYEWFKMGVTEKVKLNHKHTAEFNEDNDIVFVEDADYESQIIAKVMA